MRQQILNRRRGSEIVAGDYATFRADVFAPAKARTRFDGHARVYVRRQQAISILLRLPFEELPRWHADHAATNALRREPLVRLHAELHFRSGAHQDDLRLA